MQAQKKKQAARAKKKHEKKEKNENTTPRMKTPHTQCQNCCSLKGLLQSKDLEIRQLKEKLIGINMHNIDNQMMEGLEELVQEGWPQGNLDPTNPNPTNLEMDCSTQSGRNPGLNPDGTPR